MPEGAVKTHRIRLVPALENSRSLAFDPVVRELMSIYVPSGTSPSAAAASVGNVGPAINGRPPALLLKIGRFTEKNPTAAAAAAANAAGGEASGSGTGSAMTIAGGGGDVCSNKVAFKSKVVSRAHAEIWCENGGKVSLTRSDRWPARLIAVLHSRHVEQLGDVLEPYQAVKSEYRVEADDAECGFA